MKKTFVLALLAFALVTMATAAHAEFRIATVDINRILNESKEAQAKKSELDAASASAKKDLDQRRASLQATEKKLKDSGTSTTSKEAETFRAQAREFVRLAKDTEEKLRGEFVKSNKALTEKTLRIVEAYAKKNAIDLVLDKSEKVRGAVMFRAAPFDITNEIIAQVNAG